jgi:hypothetical protein
MSWRAYADDILDLFHMRVDFVLEVFQMTQNANVVLVSSMW